MSHAVLSVSGPAQCTINGRLNRFVVQVEIGGLPYRASINNTGRLLEFLAPGGRGFCVRRGKPLKTDFRLFAIEDKGQGAIIDTQLQMTAFERALEMRAVPWLSGYRMVRRNAPLGGNSLIDYLLTDCGGKACLEVKSAALREGEYAMYPDCPTARGRKHIQELTGHCRKGGKAFILFMAALPDIRAFRPCQEADPEVFRLLGEARRAGVVLKAINIVYRPDDSSIILLNPDLPVEL
jgi:sugar fermentation stimulation protein A